jgi:hypothetical protein
MANDDCWNPVVCSSCGTIVGQLPSNDQREAIERIGKVLTIEEHLKKIVWYLQAFEEKTDKK